MTPQFGLILLVKRVLVHVHIHGRCKQHRCLGGHDRGGQQVVGNATSHLADDVGGCRGDQEQVCPVCQRDMADLLLLDQIEQFGMHRVMGQGLEGKRCDKLGCRFGHDYMNLGPGLAQQAQQFNRLVDGNAAADSQNNGLSAQIGHGLVQVWVVAFFVANGG